MNEFEKGFVEELEKLAVGKFRQALKYTVWKAAPKGRKLLTMGRRVKGGLKKLR